MEDKFAEEECARPFDPKSRVHVSVEEYDKWYQAWNQTLIVRLLGKSVNLRFLTGRLQAMWARKGAIHVLDMDGDFFLVRFDDNGDYKHALFEGPWLILDHYLLVQRWRPMFKPTKPTVQKIAAWVRFPNLPIELYNKTFLWRAGSLLGTMLRIDDRTSIQSRGKFARICVELDLRRPLVPILSVLGQEFPVEYDGLHLICFSCGKFDHRADKCPEAIMTEAQRAKVDGATNMQVEGSSGEHEVVVPDGGEEKSEAIFGTWMIAKKPSRRRPNSAKPETVANGKVVPSVPRAAKGGVQGNQSGSRFASLAHGEDNAMQVEMSLQPHPIGADSSAGPVTQAPHRPNKGADKGSTKAPLKRKLSATQKPIPATPKPTTSNNTLPQQNSDMPSKRFPLDSSGDKQPMTGVVIARQISVPPSPNSEMVLDRWSLHVLEPVDELSVEA